MLPALSSVTPGISLLPRTRGPMPERNNKLPTRFACGNAPTGSGARELSKDLLINQRSEVRSQIAPFTSNIKPRTSNIPSSSSDCAHDEEGLGAFRDCIGQGSVGRFVRHIFTAGEESHH